MDMGRVRKNYRVCDVHFDDNSKFQTYHNRTNLKYGSIPILYIYLVRRVRIKISDDRFSCDFVLTGQKSNQPIDFRVETVAIHQLRYSMVDSIFLFLLDYYHY